MGVPLISKVHPDGQRSLIMGYVNEDYLVSEMARSSIDSKVRIHIKQFANGEQIIDLKFKNSLVYPEVYVFFRILHFFVYGMPEFDPNSVDKPNDYDPDVENAPPRFIKVKLYNSLICFLG